MVTTAAAIAAHRQALETTWGTLRGVPANSCGNAWSASANSVAEP